MGRTPRSPQSQKQDTLGVGFYLNCPDRSWCVAQEGQHIRKRRHRSGNDSPSGRAQWKTGTERKTNRSFKKEKPARSQTGRTAPVVRGISPLPHATELHSVALRATTLLDRKEKPGGLTTTLDNPHRRCSAWLGRVYFCQSSTE